MGALGEGPYDATVESIVLDVDGHPVDMLHARPSGVALGGLVVAPDVWGLRPLYEDVVRRLATHGLAVCAPEPFARVPAAERAAWGLDERMAAVSELYDEIQMRDLLEAADHLAAADSVHGMSIMGFCMGGYYALKAAATGRFERAVSFYGMLRTPDPWLGPGHHAPLESAADTCPALYIVGTMDPWVPPADLEALRRLWGPRPECKVLVYPGADHGFVHDPDRDAHRPDDAADAWRHALAFLLDPD